MVCATEWSMRALEWSMDAREWWVQENCPCTCLRRLRPNHHAACADLEAARRGRYPATAKKAPGEEGVPLRRRVSDTFLPFLAGRFQMELQA